MSFAQRLWNTAIDLFENLTFNLYHIPIQKRLYKKYFPNAKRSFDEMFKSSAIIFLNSHVSSSFPRPYLPNMIDICGVHVKKANKLPDDIQNFLDSATDGAVVFSMGSFIKSKDFPENKREAFVKAFGKLKLKVLWKYENETLPNKPDNVMISSWVPQRDILAHKNLKIFITHGGLLSTTEAIMEGVPIISIPIFGDQRLNMKSAETKGFGKILAFNEISEENLFNKIQNALNDEEMSVKAKEISKLYKDRPMTPQQSTVYWVEYVIRNGAHHLKAGGLALNYIELHNIDVYCAMVVFIILIFCVNWMIFKMLIKKITKKFIKVKIN